MSFKVESATAAQGTAVTAAGPGRRPGYFVKSANSSILWLIDPGRPRMTKWPPPSIASKVWRAKLLAKLPSARQGDLAVRRPPKGTSLALARVHVPNLRTSRTSPAPWRAASTPHPRRRSGAFRNTLFPLLQLLKSQPQHSNAPSQCELSRRPESCPGRGALRRPATDGKLFAGGVRLSGPVVRNPLAGG